MDGGGFRGLGALHIINHLTKETNQKPWEIFDMMCGSSAGGLIAILLGRLKLDCATAITIYKKLTESFCGKDEDKFYNKLLARDFLETNEFDITLANIIGKYGGQVDLQMILEGQDTKVTIVVFQSCLKVFMWSYFRLLSLWSLENQITPIKLT